MTHDLIALNFVKTQFSQTTNSCFTGKVNIYSCERTLKEYVQGLFTTEVEIN